MAASVGELTGVEPVFEAVSDVPNGGVLFALPALLAIGLLHQAHKYFQLPKGYYGLESLFLMLAFLALARLPSLEQLRYCAPGEWGKLLGLDRISEVRTVREKLSLLSAQEQASAWSAELCAQWMGADPDQAAVLYVDGHVRVYHGHQTRLPRHYVARQKLCLRATCPVSTILSGQRQLSWRVWLSLFFRVDVSHVEGWFLAPLAGPSPGRSP